MTATMSGALKRAETYASIFIGLGDRWRYNVPCDATMGEGETVVIGGVRMERGKNNEWRLTEGDSSWVVRAAGGAA